ncbi:MAG: hypothetical protein IK103_01700 [Bacteroidales bacterium]|nr:hypothetical protein [Bacteroidales bacterium]
MKKIFKYFASTILLAGLVFVSCSKEDIVPANPEEDGEHIYTLTITASKEKAPDTKLLELGGVDNKTLYKKWVLNDEVSVYKGETLAGTLRATTVSADGFDATLTGQLTGTAIATGDELVMKYRSQEYGNQDGTLAGIASTCDYAEAEVTVASVDGSGNITTTADALFKSQQAIVKFTLKNETGDLVPVTKLTIKAEGATDKVEVTPPSRTSEVFVALAGISSKNLILEAKGSDGFDYSFRKADVTFDHSKYYGINVKMFCANTTPLTIMAKNAGTTVKVTNKAAGTIYYKVNNGDEQQIGAGVTSYSISLPNAGDKVSFFGNNNRYGSVNSDGSSNISCNNEFYMYGNIMSLTNKTDFSNIPILPGTRTFSYLFYNNPSLLNHGWKKLVLPATTLLTGCYEHMFELCTALTETPELPATTLAESCYNGMFYRCSTLVKAPDLPAESLGIKSCFEMFKNCTSLVSVPTSLPATSLGNGCYSYMFEGCTSLQTAPSLPAEVLTPNCYLGMFGGCTSLVTPPALPAESLESSCYKSMFDGCKNLATAPNLPAQTLKSSCYENMFTGCSSIVSAPVISATTLATSCCKSMFYGCTSLVAAPALSASTASKDCYNRMFYGCTNLTTIPSTLPGGELAQSCYEQMFGECSKIENAPTFAVTSIQNRACYRMFYKCTKLKKAGGISFNCGEGKLASECCLGMFDGCKALTAGPTLFSATIAEGSCCSNMFNGCENLETFPAILPAMTVGNQSYYQMFRDCIKMTTAPTLPATELTAACYKSMFYNCTSLETAPALPATTLVANCYQTMFYGCTSLASAPALAATTLASNCYSGMFQNCSSLVIPPSLSVTSLEQSCYSSMFYNCTSLAAAPVLPATTLATSCYQNMFYNCTNLSFVKCLATDISASKCTYNWLSGVASTGTFVKAASMTSWELNSVNGIPTGWTVSDAS